MLENLIQSDQKFVTFCEHLPEKMTQEDREGFSKAYLDVVNAFEEVYHEDFLSQSENQMALRDWLRKRRPFYQLISKLESHMKDVSDEQSATVVRFIQLTIAYDNFKKEFTQMSFQVENSNLILEKLNRLISSQEKMNHMYQTLFQTTELLDERSSLPREKQENETMEDYFTYLNHFYEKKKFMNGLSLEEQEEKKEEEPVLLEKMDSWLDHYDEFIATNPYYKNLDIQFPIFQQFSQLLERSFSLEINLLKVSSYEIEVRYLEMDHKQEVKAKVMEEEGKILKDLLAFEQSYDVVYPNQNEIKGKYQHIDEYTQMIMISQLFQCFYLLETRPLLKKEEKDALEHTISFLKEKLGMKKEKIEQPVVKFDEKKELPRVESYYEHGSLIKQETHEPLIQHESFVKQETHERPLQHIAVYKGELTNLQDQALQTITNQIKETPVYSSLEDANIPEIGEVVQTTQGELYAPLDVTICELRFINSERMVSAFNNIDALKLLQSGYTLQQIGYKGVNGQIYYCSPTDIQKESFKL